MKKKFFAFIYISSFTRMIYHATENNTTHQQIYFLLRAKRIRRTSGSSRLPICARLAYLPTTIWNTRRLLNTHRKASRLQPVVRRSYEMRVSFLNLCRSMYSTRAMKLLCKVASVFKSASYCLIASCNSRYIIGMLSIIIPVALNENK